MANPEVTVIGLIYRSPAWLKFMVDGIMKAKNETPYDLMIVGNNPSYELFRNGFITHKYFDTAPNDHWVSRMWRCWNWAIGKADTRYVILTESDMRVSDFWIDGLLYDMRDKGPKVIPTSLLIESGRVPSAMPEWVKDFGQSPDTFDEEGFLARAKELRRPGYAQPGRLYMPVILDRLEWEKRGQFCTCPDPHHSNDVEYFKTLQKDGYMWITSHGSVVYHIPRGESSG